MAASIRSRRMSNLQTRAARQDILWMHRRNALWCLTGTQKLGEKSQLWCQKLINAMRDQYSELEVQRDLDELQARLDRQKQLLKRRLSRDEAEKEAERRAKAEARLRKSQAKSKPPTATALPDGTSFDPFAI